MQAADRRERRRWPWVLAAATMVIFLATNAVVARADLDLAGLFDLATLLYFVFVGAFLCARVPGNVVGTLLLASGVTLAATITLSSLAAFAAEQGTVPNTAVAAAGLVSNIGFAVELFLVLVGIPLVFPDGHLLSARWRWIVVLCVAAVGASAVASFVGPEPLGRPEMPNPFQVPELTGLADVLDVFTQWVAAVAFGAAALAIVLRYRRDDDVERHQLKWLIGASLVAAVAFPISLFSPWQAASDVALAVALVALLALPLAIGVAILRYRLYAIDQIISRTIAWAVISGLLLGSFALLVVVLQTVLVDVTQGDVLAVAASTLVAFALFQPVRRTVQAAVDRRFDRARYDAQRTADSFADRLRNEVDLDTLAAELEATVADTIRPRAAVLWLPGRHTP
ncbi:MAG TPA: hypothetical protein VFV72_11880 [Candidatus Limnocylindrales bacterium]|nr:hypothetical protein [Candidatus Limnocylindrales bacterium]